MVRLKTSLRDYQSKSVKSIKKHDGWLLGYDMGCGKTLPVIAYMNEARPKMTLIATPKRVMGVWPKEFSKHLGEDHGFHIVVLDKKPKLRSEMSVKDKLEFARKEWARAEKAKLPVVFVVSHDSLRMDPLASAFLKPIWDLTVIDEIHRIKSPSGATSRYMGKLADRTAKRIGMTGTIMPHSPLDVFGQFRFIDRKIFGWKFTPFKARYATMGGYKVNGRPVQVTGYKNLEELNRKIYSRADRVMKKDVLKDLPEIVHQDWMINLPKEAEKIYNDMRDDMIAELKEFGVDSVASNAMVKLLRLQQITSGFTTDEHDVVRPIHEAKQKAVEDFLDSVDKDEPVAVFARFRWDLEAIERAAKEAGRPVDILHGGQNDIGAVWEPRPGCVGAIQIQAGGTGIDLTATRYNVLFSQTWNMGDYDQLLSRSHRHGQRNAVTVVHLLADIAKSVDLKIRKALDKRSSLVNATLSQDELSRAILGSFLHNEDDLEI